MSPNANVHQQANIFSDEKLS